MKELHALVDYENVQPSLEALAKQAQAFATSHEWVTLVPRSGQGPNALDFHLAFYMGYVAARHPDAELVVVANDRGYDPMLAHARMLKFRARRVGYKAPVVKKAAVVKPAAPVAVPMAAKKAVARKAVAPKPAKAKQPAKPSKPASAPKEPPRGQGTLQNSDRLYQNGQQSAAKGKAVLAACGRSAGQRQHSRTDRRHGGQAGGWRLRVVHR